MRDLRGRCLSFTRVGKKSIYTHFAPPNPCAMLTKHFHLTQVCILPFSNIERGNGGVDTYSVRITIIMSCFWHFPTQFVQGCSYCSREDPVGTSDHVYFVHPSTNVMADISTDTSVECRSTYRPILSRYLGPISRSTYRPTLDRHIDRDMSVDMSIDRLVEISVEYRSICRPRYPPSIGRYVDQHSTDTLIIDCRWKIGRLSVVYRSTVVFCIIIRHEIFSNY